MESSCKVCGGKHRTGECTEKPKKRREESPEQVWNKFREELRGTIDNAGRGLDKGIIDILVACKAHGLNTNASCEGHTDSGWGAPYVEFEACDGPKETRAGEKAIFERVARKYGLTVDELTKDIEHETEYQEAVAVIDQQGETEESKKFRAENKKLMKRVRALLDEFYKRRKSEEAVKVEIHDVTDEVGWGRFRIFSGKKDYSFDFDGDTLDDKSKKELIARQKKYREEMSAFAQFLKEKYFSAHS